MTIGERLVEMPRAVRWAIIAGIAFVLYFAAVEPALGLYTRFSQDAQDADARLAEFEAQVRDREEDLAAFERGLSRHGEVLPPRPVAEVKADVIDLWREMELGFESLSGLRTQSSESGLQSEPIQRELVPPGAELVRVVLTADFEASPEDIVDLIGRLEASPIVHAVSSVRLRLAGEDQRVLSVQVVTESWAHTGGGAAR